ncbi:MAG: glycosyltransferase family 9 protein [bacterium]
MANNNIFIFQVRRIGDFFQSIPLIQSLYNKLNNKETGRIDIFINENIAGIADIFINNVNLLTYKDIFKSFTLNNDISLSSLNGLSLFEFIKFSNKFNSFLSKFLEKYGLAVNLNYDIVNSLFINFFKNEKKGDIAYNKSSRNNEIILRAGASNYLFNSVKSRNLNKINIVDIFSLIGINKPADIKPGYDILKLQSRKKGRQSDKNQSRIRICISIGATSVKRVWSSENYAALIMLISNNFNCEITIIGTAEEAEAAAEIKKNISPNINIIDLTGKTNAGELIYFIKDFDLLISADTGTLHIAQIFNIPSVSIFTGNANFYETGPHIRNSLVIHSKADCYPCFEHEPCRFNYACKNDVKPDDVFDLTLLQLKTNKFDCKNMNRSKYLKIIKNNIKNNIKKGNFSVSLCKHLNSVHFYPFVKEEIGKTDMATEVLKFGWITVLSEDYANINFDKILRNTKKYYKINKITVKYLISEMSFIKNVFENGRYSFGQDENKDSAYFEKFKESVKSIGSNYNYLKLACDYFIDEIKSAGTIKAFNDIILLLDNTIQILKMF